MIQRLNIDLGNSLTSAMINGSPDILEFPTALVPITKEQAEDYFPDTVDKAKFRDSIMIEYDRKIYLIGNAARRKLGNDLHIGHDLHNKSTSIVPYIMFLGVVATYIVENEMNENEISIDYFSTMLPIFELRQAIRFADKLNDMAKRFSGSHQFRILTTGHERDITINIHDSRCYAEGFVAKYAMQYGFDLQPNVNAGKFLEDYVINVDIGGGTIDMVRLGPGLAKPTSRDDFKTITDAPYLGMIKELREGLLRPYFKSSRELELFIVKNYETAKYEWINGKTGETESLKTIIEQALKEYVSTFMPIVLESYPVLPDGLMYRYNYFGGVAPILRNAIHSYLREQFSESIVSRHHIEPNETSRYLNLYGLEIVSRQNTIALKVEK